jgi:hypothetical protein
MSITSVRISSIRAALAVVAVFAPSAVTPRAVAGDVSFQASAVRVGLEKKGNIFTSHLTGTGTAIGPFDAVSTIKVPGHRAYGPVTLTDAGGDTLTFDTDVLFDKHFVRGDGTYVVTGGTGQFAGATGSGAFSVEHLADDTTVATWDGTLSF